jgi:hypothetical protein
MKTLCAFQDRLQQAMPSFEWRCEPAGAKLIPNTDVPEAIVITARAANKTVAGTSCELDGHMLLRWGIDSSARLVLRELPDDLV